MFSNRVCRAAIIAVVIRGDTINGGGYHEQIFFFERNKRYTFSSPRPVFYATVVVQGDLKSDG